MLSPGYELKAKIMDKLDDTAGAEAQRKQANRMRYHANI
jgi:hypothetical protein